MVPTFSALQAMMRGDNRNEPFIVITLDLTNAAITFTAKDEHGALVFRRRSLAAGGSASEVSIQSATQCTVLIVPANTSGLLRGQRLSWDLQVVTAGGVTGTPHYGHVDVLADVTR